MIEAPVSTVAGLVALVAVLPLTPGSVDVTSKITLAGMSTESGISSSELMITVTSSPSFSKPGLSMAALLMVIWL